MHLLSSFSSENKWLHFKRVCVCVSAPRCDLKDTAVSFYLQSSNMLRKRFSSSNPSRSETHAHWNTCKDERVKAWWGLQHPNPFLSPGPHSSPYKHLPSVFWIFCPSFSFCRTVTLILEPNSFSRVSVGKLFFLLAPKCHWTRNKVWQHQGCHYVDMATFSNFFYNI